MELRRCIALGLPFFERDVQRARVAFVATEDDAAELHYRIAQQAQTLSLTLDDLAEHLFVYALGEDESLFTVAADRRAVATPLFNWLRAEFRAAGIEVVLLDNATRLFAIDLIRPGEVSKCIAKSKQLVPAGGNIIVLAHVDKATAKGRLQQRSLRRDGRMARSCPLPSLLPSVWAASGEHARTGPNGHVL